MIVDKESYISLKNEIISLSKEYISQEELKNFSDHIENKVASFKPTLMVYGVYNAGKSTLLNAIFGVDEMSQTGDAPETAEVHPFEYNGYTIYDTPGINAPIKHEEVTIEHLKKTELVLFVMSNDGSFEERYVYEKIGDIIKDEKPVLIVLNNKKGIDINSSVADEEINKINAHLSKICDEVGIKEAEKKVKIVYVDAKTALDGKLENEDELIQSSNILLLESEIEKLLGESSGTNVKNALDRFIIEFILRTITNIDGKIDRPQEKLTQELLTYLEKLKQKTESELKNMALESVAIITNSLVEKLLAKENTSITPMIEKVIGEINESVNQKLESVKNEIRSKIGTFESAMQRLSIDVSDMKSKNSNVTENSERMPDSDSSGTAVAVGTAVANFIPPTLVIPTPLGPIPVKPVVQFALTVYVIFAGSNEAKTRAEAELEEKRRHHLAAKNRGEEFGFKYKQNLLKNVDANILNLFDSIIKQYIDFSKSICEQNDSLLQTKAKLQDILNSLK